MDDPYIHVGSNLNLDGAVRNMVAATLGVASDLPPVVTTGCGLQVPRGNTSRLPERVTCLPCREYAHRQFLRYADQLERLGQLPDMNITGAQMQSAATTSREIAAKFVDPDDHHGPGPHPPGC